MLRFVPRVGTDWTVAAAQSDSAASPLTLIGLLPRFGRYGLLRVIILCSCGALLILFLLSRHRPAVAAGVPQNSEIRAA